MIDITTVTQVNAHWIFTKNGERIKSTAENVRNVWEQAKIKHMIYNMVVDDLSVDYLRALADHYYKIEIQAHNVLFANRW